MFPIRREPYEVWVTYFRRREAHPCTRPAVLISPPAMKHLSEHATLVPAASYIELPPLIMLRPCRVFRHIRFQLALLHVPSSLLYIPSRFQISVCNRQCLHNLAGYRFLWRFRYLHPLCIHRSSRCSVASRKVLYFDVRARPADAVII